MNLLYRYADVQQTDGVSLDEQPYDVTWNLYGAWWCHRMFNLLQLIDS